MLRNGIVALMISIMSVGGLQAGDGRTSSSLLGLFRGPSIGRTQQHSTGQRSSAGGVTHAVVADVDRQVPEIRQTSVQPPGAELQPAESAPQPTPVQYAQQAASNLPIPGPRTFQQTGNQTTPTSVSRGHNTPTQFASSGHVLPGVSSGWGMGGGFSHHPHHLINGAYIPGNAGGSSSGSAGALYPSPKPGIPQQVGGTSIVHQALHPHEMLYAHRYKSMYGPFYYKVRGGWMVTPFGVWSKENWKLQGTTVDVKYKSHISPFAMFHRPVIR